MLRQTATREEIKKAKKKAGKHLKSKGKSFSRLADLRPLAFLYNR